MAERVYIGLGANLGDRAASVESAKRALRKVGVITAKSRIYETEPWGVPDPQPRYLNAVVVLETALGPYDLLKELLDIEMSLGRGPHQKNHPRSIDLDILFFGDHVLSDPETGLVIPHPRLHERAFVLVPLAEIAPSFQHPVLRRTIAELLFAIDQSQVQRWEPD